MLPSFAAKRSVGLDTFCSTGEPGAASPRDVPRDGLRRMLTGVYETLRAPVAAVLELGERPSLADAIARFRSEAELLAADDRD